MWNKWTGEIVNALVGDSHVVNCVQPHPCSCRKSHVTHVCICILREEGRRGSSTRERGREGMRET